MFVVGFLYLLLMVSFAVPGLFIVTVPVYFLVGQRALRRRRVTVVEHRQQLEQQSLDAVVRYFSGRGEVTYIHSLGMEAYLDSVPESLRFELASPERAWVTADHYEAG